MRKRIAVLLVSVAIVCLWAVIARVRASSPSQYTINLYASYPNKNLLRPTGIFKTGFLLFSDSGHHKVRALEYLNPGWQLVEMGGDGTAGYKDSTHATTAEFNYPTGVSGAGPIEIHTQYGNVEFVGVNVMDGQNYTVRRICFYLTPMYATPCTPVGVSTRAGTNVAGYMNGQGTAARFESLASSPVLNPSDPSALANYVADPFNNVIRYVDSSNNVSTYAGTGSPGYVNGPKASAKFNGPSSATMDAAQNIYISDVGNFVIRKIDTSSNVSTFAGSGTQGYVDGPATTAQFAMPTGIVYNPNDHYWYVADAGNNCIRRIDSTGKVSTYAGAQTAGEVDGSLSLARFASPADIAFGSSYYGDSDKMYITDSANNAIRQIDMTTGQVTTIYK